MTGLPIHARVIELVDSIKMKKINLAMLQTDSIKTYSKYLQVKMFFLIKV